MVAGGKQPEVGLSGARPPVQVQGALVLYCGRHWYTHFTGDTEVQKCCYMSQVTAKKGQN